MWGETDVSEPQPLLAYCSSAGECKRGSRGDYVGGGNSWLVYQSSLVVLPAEKSGASRRNGRRSENFAFSVSFIRQRIFNMPYNLTDMGLPALLPIRRKVYCGFLSPLKIHRLSRVWTRDPWVQWQAHWPLCPAGWCASFLPSWGGFPTWCLVLLVLATWPLDVTAVMFRVLLSSLCCTEIIMWPTDNIYTGNAQYYQPLCCYLHALYPLL
jgi:hypothetical protein